MMLACWTQEVSLGIDESIKLNKTRNMKETLCREADV